jgi:hypothetical protein
LSRAKKALISTAVEVEKSSGGSVPVAKIEAANLAAWSVNSSGPELAIDPERGRFLFLGATSVTPGTVTYHYGFSGEIGAGTYARRHVEALTADFTIQGGGEVKANDIAQNGVTRIKDSATYTPVKNRANIKSLTMLAANQQRPYLRLRSKWTLKAGSSTDWDATLSFDGLWIGSDGNHAVVLQGDYERVVIRSCTFDPGGVDAGGNAISALPLVVEGQIEELVIEKSIMAPIRTKGTGAVEKLVVRDSILQSINTGAPALSVPKGTVVLERVTIFGGVDVNRLWATEALVTGKVDVTNTQDGCFRFGAAPPGSRLPHPYESHAVTDTGHIFTSRTFGHPGYAQLSETAPIEIRRGAENGSEMGAFSSLLNPIKLDSLRAKVDEYMPFGLIPIFIYET